MTVSKRYLYDDYESDDRAYGVGYSSPTTPPAKRHAPCYESHPALSMGSDTVIYGGSCLHPTVNDADIYVGLDRGMNAGKQAYPWEAGEAFLYPISDMNAPSDAVSFTKLIDWLSVQLIAGKKVHVGCIGGHGRTGTVLAALTKVMLGDKNAIEYVRKNYCKKAVESASQVAFLGKHFGIDKAAPTKDWSVKPTSTGKTSWNTSSTSKVASHFTSKVPAPRVPLSSQRELLPLAQTGMYSKATQAILGLPKAADKELSVKPVAGSMSDIWGANMELTKPKKPRTI